MSSSSALKESLNDSNSTQEQQWVEILEPKTRVQMFANLITGECRWDEPRGQGVVISRASNPRLTQWWELYDNNSQRFYYYCAKDSKTVWRRPTTPDAIVVPLAKLQILKQNTTTVTTPTGRQSSPKPPPLNTSSVGTQTEAQLCSRATQTTQTETNYLFQNSFRNPSLKHYLISEARLTHAMKARDTDIGHDFEYDSNDDFEDVLDDSDLSCDADDEYDCDYTDDDDSEEDVDGIGGRYSSNRRQANEDSEEEIPRSIVRKESDRYEEPIISAKSRSERQTLNSLLAVTQTNPIGGQSQSMAIGGQSLPTKSHSLTQISSNLSRNNSNSVQTSERKRLTTQVATSTTPIPHLRPQTPPNSRQISQTLSLVPTPTTTTTTSTTSSRQKSDKESQKTSLLSIESFAKENIERHRKRGIFIGKKVSLKSMLEWSKKSIKKPMISSISDQKLRHESKVMFKFVQKFMRDLTTTAERQLTTADDTDIAVYLLTTATQQPILRDELLVQIARQTTNNPSEDSELRGLRLMCICFWYFPPSAKLAPHLQQFVSSHLNPFARVLKRKFEQQLRRSLSSHVVYVRKPHDKEEVSRVVRCVECGHVGVFGETLSDALIDGRLIPWPIVSLTEALLRCHGNGDSEEDGNGNQEREGVFRCVGDLDEVTRLKIKIDTTLWEKRDSLTIDSQVLDIHVIASALKLYFRELKEPLIPFELYSEAIKSAHDWTRAQQLVESLPTVNRLSLSYLIRFLQVFSAPEHVRHTKMDDANLSMVWAPNILRLNSQQTIEGSLSGIFERTRDEMSFVRQLIQELDTSFMSGIQ